MTVTLIFVIIAFAVYYDSKEFKPARDARQKEAHGAYFSMYLNSQQHADGIEWKDSTYCAKLMKGDY